MGCPLEVAWQGMSRATGIMLWLFFTAAESSHHGVFGSIPSVGWRLPKRVDSMAFNVGYSGRYFSNISPQLRRIGAGMKELGTGGLGVSGYAALPGERLFVE